MKNKILLTYLGVAGLVLLATPGKNIPPKISTVPSKSKPKPVAPQGKGSGDMFNYFFDIPGTGMIEVKTESKDVQWGSPLLAESKIPQYQSMVRRWSSLVDDIGSTYRVPSKEIFAIMYSESGGNERATSKVGARGLMQVMPFNFPAGVTDAQSYDPKTNITAGVRLMAMRRGNGSHDIVQVASMYNAGANLDNTPYTNEQKPGLATRWGYASEPGYIDSVVAAYNTGVREGVA